MVYRIALIDEILPLRAAVLRPGLPLTRAAFDGDTEPTTMHFGAFEVDAVVGCLTMKVAPLDGKPAWQLRGMAVSAEHRGTGVGRSLLDLACVVIQTREYATLVWCNARSSAVAFYQKQGWKIISDEFVIEGVGPHFRMSREI